MFTYDDKRYAARDAEVGVRISRSMVSTDGGGILFDYVREPDGPKMTIHVRTPGDQGGPAALEAAKKDVEEIRITLEIARYALDDFRAAKALLGEVISEAQAMNALAQGMEALLTRGDPARASKFDIAWLQLHPEFPNARVGPPPFRPG